MVIINISDQPGAVDTIERSEFEFSCPTAKEVCCWYLCSLHKFMTLYDTGARADKWERQTLTLPTTPALDFDKIWYSQPNNSTSTTMRSHTTS